MVEPFEVHLGQGAVNQSDVFEPEPLRATASSVPASRRCSPFRRAMTSTRARDRSRLPATGDCYAAVYASFVWPRRQAGKEIGSAGSAGSDATRARVAPSPRTITIRSRRRRNRPGRTASSRDDFVDLSVRGEPSSNSVGRRSWSFRSFTRTSRSCGGALTLLPGLADAHLVGAGPAVRDQLLPAAAAYGSSAAPEGRLPIVGSFDRNPPGPRLCTRTCDSCGARDLPPNLGGAATRRSAPDQR